MSKLVFSDDGRHVLCEICEAVAVPYNVRRKVHRCYWCEPRLIDEDADLPVGLKRRRYVKRPVETDGDA
jgi:hypothetical protein